MDNKKVQVTIVISLFICLAAILAIGSSIKKENFMPQKVKVSSEKDNNDKDIENEFKRLSDDLASGRYYIYLVEDYMPNESDTLEIGVDGTATLKIVDLTKIDNENSNTYSVNLNAEEFEKVKKILEHIGESNNLSTNEEYNFYYNYEQTPISNEDKEYLVAIIDAVTNIAFDSEIVDNQTRREIGNNSLDSMIVELNLDNVFK